MTLAQDQHYKKREYFTSLTNRYNKKYLGLVNKPPTSFFKKLFVGTKLRQAMIIMSEDKEILKGLMNEEVERGKIKRPPIPYIPGADMIGDAVKDSAGTNSFKVSLPGWYYPYHAVFDNGLNEAFVIHVLEIIKFCKHKGFYDAYKPPRLNLWIPSSERLLPRKNSKMPRLTQHPPKKRRKR